MDSSPFGAAGHCFSCAFRGSSLVGLVGCPSRFCCRGRWGFPAIVVLLLFLFLLFAASRSGFGWCPFGVLALFCRLPRGLSRFRQALEKQCRTLAVQRKDVIHE